MFADKFNQFDCMWIARTLDSTFDMYGYFHPLINLHVIFMIIIYFIDFKKSPKIHIRLFCCGGLKIEGFGGKI